MQFQPDSYLSANSSLWAKEHVGYNPQCLKADEVWSLFVLDKSWGFTTLSVEQLNDSIRTYIWEILGAQAQTCWGILGARTSFNAQRQFMATVEDARLAPVDIPSGIDCYQIVFQNTSSRFDYTFGTELFMDSSYIWLHIGNITGYNNDIMIAQVRQPSGVSSDIYSILVPTPAETEATGLVKQPPGNDIAIGIPKAPVSVDSPANSSMAANIPSDHKEENTALMVDSIVIGLAELWLLPGI